MSESQGLGVRACEECEEPIAKERIRVQPDAALCIRCAEEQERMWGCKVKTMEIVVNGQDFDDYDGYEEFITAGKWRRPRPR